MRYNVKGKRWRNKARRDGKRKANDLSSPAHGTYPVSLFARPARHRGKPVRPKDFSFMRTSDRFVITHESDILYTLGDRVIGKRLMAIQYALLSLGTGLGNIKLSGIWYVPYGAYMYPVYASVSCSYVQVDTLAPGRARALARSRVYVRTRVTWAVRWNAACHNPFTLFDISYVAKMHGGVCLSNRPVRKRKNERAVRAAPSKVQYMKKKSCSKPEKCSSVVWILISPTVPSKFEKITFLLDLFFFSLISNFFNVTYCSSCTALNIV